LVTAVQLDLDTKGFTYRKWGGEQSCKPGDWIVENDGDVYTVDREVFEATYEKRGQGTYAQVSRVWAEVAGTPGAVETKEGVTHYSATAYLVSNDADGRDRWAIEADRFEEMYEPAS
jgi:hypothetical protein